VLTYAPGRADRWPRTRQPGTRATDRGPGSAALMFVNLATGSQTRTDQQHKHKHGPGSSCATRQQLRDQVGRQPPAPGTRTRDQLGRQPPAPGPGSADQAAAARITASAAVTDQQITARAAVTGQRITANQAARPTAQAATGSSCATQTRQQLRTDTRATFYASIGQDHAPSSGGQLGDGLAGTNQRAHGWPVRYQAKKSPARGRARIG